MRRAKPTPVLPDFLERPLGGMTGSHGPGHHDGGPVSERLAPTLMQPDQSDSISAHAISALARMRTDLTDPIASDICSNALCGRS
jgi:hypothetical protein